MRFLVPTFEFFPPSRLPLFRPVVNLASTTEETPTLVSANTPTMRLFLLLAMLFTATSARAAWKLTPVSSLQKLPASTPGVLLPFRAQPVVLRAARGEWESFQFVVTAGARPIENLRITPNGLATIGAEFLASSQLQIYRENYARVEKPSGNAELRPLWWPDALLPLGQSARIPAGQSAVFWATIRVPVDAAAGDYFGELDVNADGENRRLALTLAVENKTLPPPTFRATVAVYYDVLRDWYEKNANQTFTETQWELQKRRIYDLLLDYRVNAYDLPVSWDAPDAEKYLRDPRVTSVRVPPLDDPQFDVAVAKLRANNALNKAFYYWIDEPDTTRYNDIRATTQRLRALGIKHLVTVHPNDELRGEVDIWAPNVGDFFGIGGLDFAALQRERKAGHETWLYTMIEPKFPTPTWLLDEDAQSVRAYGAFWRKHGFNGFVYSMAHGWGPKPLENLVSFQDTNGDGTLIYPGEIVGASGPLPSIRLMILRDALEDYELKRTATTPLFPRERAALPDFTIAKGAPVALDGRLTEWPTQNFVTLTRDGAVEPNLPATKMWARRDDQFLFFAFRVQNPQVGDWIAVEIAPDDPTRQPEKWRFVATLKGASIAEKWTRAGRFQAEIADYRAVVQNFAGFANVEVRIPLAALPTPFRLGALRRTSDPATETRVVLRAFADTGDPFLMPHVRF